MINCKNNFKQKYSFFIALVLALVFSLSFIANEEAFANSKHKGKASWYGTTAHGKMTANGETFFRYKFSAAHKTLPFGTVVRVHNASNDREVLVRVNDRGPFIKGRVIDLSKRAANNLNMLGDGVATVEFEEITDTEGRPLNPQNAFFVRLENAEDAQKAHKLSADIEDALEQKVKALRDSKRNSFSLCVGPYRTFQEAESSVRDIEKAYSVLDIIEAPASGKILPFFAMPSNLGSKLNCTALGYNDGLATLEIGTN